MVEDTAAKRELEELAPCTVLQAAGLIFLSQPEHATTAVLGNREARIVAEARHFKNGLGPDTK